MAHNWIIKNDNFIILNVLEEQKIYENKDKSCPKEVSKGNNFSIFISNHKTFHRIKKLAFNYLWGQPTYYEKFNSLLC